MSMKKKQPNRKKKESPPEMKAYCPVCGSTQIKAVGARYACLNCKALFFKPAIARMQPKKKPNYIG